LNELVSELNKLRSFDNKEMHIHRILNNENLCSANRLSVNKNLKGKPAFSLRNTF